jgi:hypothetical protein
LDLVFNESLETASSQLVSNYFANNGIGNPVSATLQADQKTVRLTFGNSFSNGIQNQLTLMGIKDLAGNSMSSIKQNFLFFQPTTLLNKDIIITEIFADLHLRLGCQMLNTSKFIIAATTPST